MRRIAAPTTLAGVLLFTSVASAQAPATPACTAPVTTCGGESGYYVPSDDREKVEKQLDPLLKELRACLDSAGGRHVTPQIVIRFDSDGKPMSTKVEAGGYESVPCVASVEGKLVNARSAHETYVRCEYGCPKPKPATPPPPPPFVPVPAPGPQVQPQPPPPQPAPQPAPAPTRKVHTEKVWYGWQNLAADVGSGTLLVAGVAAKSSGVTVGGAVAYVFASPIVHWVHGNGGAGAGSLLMRVLLPPVGFGIGVIAGAIVGASKTNNSLDEAGSAIAVGAIVGTTTGVLIPVALDAAALGYEKVDVEEETKAAKAQPSFSIVPTINGVAGTF